MTTMNATLSGRCGTIIRNTDKTEEVMTVRDGKPVGLCLLKASGDVLILCDALAQDKLRAYLTFQPLRGAP